MDAIAVKKPRRVKSKMGVQEVNGGWHFNVLFGTLALIGLGHEFSPRRKVDWEQLLPIWEIMLDGVVYLAYWVPEPFWREEGPVKNEHVERAATFISDYLGLKPGDNRFSGYESFLDFMFYVMMPWTTRYQKQCTYCVDIPKPNRVAHLNANGYRPPITLVVPLTGHLHLIARSNNFLSPYSCEELPGHELRFLIHIGGVEMIGKLSIGADTGKQLKQRINQLLPKLARDHVVYIVNKAINSYLGNIITDVAVSAVWYKPNQGALT